MEAYYMNNGTKTFRSTLGGYNREDVNTYIKETDLKHAEELEALKKFLDAAKEESANRAAALQSALLERDAANAQVKAEMNAAAELSKAKDSEIAELTKRLNLLKAETEAQNNVINSLREEKSTLSAQIEEDRMAAVSAQKEADEKLRTVRAEYEAQLVQAGAQQETVAELRAENEALTGTLNQAAEEAILLRESSEKLNGRIAELEAQLSAALEEVSKKNDELTAKEEEIAALIADHEIALSQCISKARGDVAERGSDAYKLAMYDKVSSQLGDILIGANRNADEIISAARQEAEKLRTDTDIECEQKREECEASVSRTRIEVEEEAAYIRERLSYATSELLSGVSTDLHANTENCIRELTACVEDMQYEIRALFSRLTARSAEMNDRIDYYQSCVAEGVNSRLSEMDEKYGISTISNPADGENNAESR